MRSHSEPLVIRTTSRDSTTGCYIWRTWKCCFVCLRVCMFVCVFGYVWLCMCFADVPLVGVASSLELYWLLHIFAESQHIIRNVRITDIMLGDTLTWRGIIAAKHLWMISEFPPPVLPVYLPSRPLRSPRTLSIDEQLTVASSHLCVGDVHVYVSKLLTSIVVRVLC